MCCILYENVAVREAACVLTYDEHVAAIELVAAHILANR